MTKYEELVAEYDQEVNIEERNMQNDGLYCDNFIWIKGTLTTAEKTSIMAEEIGHYKTTAGDILDQNKLANVKQELLARKWAYEKIIPISDINKAVTQGITEVYDLAEHFEVTEEFMIACLKHYGF